MEHYLLPLKRQGPVSFGGIGTVIIGVGVNHTVHTRERDGAGMKWSVVHSWWFMVVAAPAGMRFVGRSGVRLSSPSLSEVEGTVDRRRHLLLCSFHAEGAPGPDGSFHRPQQV
jgi:hypothetical protein